jgi:hypothetical protein
MSDVIFDKVQNLLQTVSNDVTKMHEESQSNNEIYLEALDDLAANILGLQSIIAAMVKQYPVNADDAKAWLQESMTPDAEGTEKAEAVVDYLLQQ